jgi:hypothetical protein
MDIVIEYGLMIDLKLLWGNWWKRSTLRVKEFMELLSVFLLEESTE